MINRGDDELIVRGGWRFANEREKVCRMLRRMADYVRDYV
jgi:hypothetical protein